MSFQVACLVSPSHMHLGRLQSSPGFIPVTGPPPTLVNIEPLAGRWLGVGVGVGSRAERQVLEASMDLLVETSRVMNVHSGLGPVV